MRFRVTRKSVGANEVWATECYLELGVHHVHEGVYYLEEHGRVTPIEAGGAILMFPGLKFRLFTEDEGCRGVGIYSHHIGASIQATHCVVVKPDRQLARLGKEILDAMASPGPMYRDLVRAAANHFVAAAYVKAAPQLEPPVRDGAFWVEHAVALIDATIEENVPLRTLFADIPFCYEHLLRHFKKARGMTPQQYRSHVRIERAVERLESSGDSITAIAMELGYSSSQHFATDFRKHRGASPGEWRASAASGLASASASGAAYGA